MKSLVFICLMMFATSAFVHADNYDDRASAQSAARAAQEATTSQQNIAIVSGYVLSLVQRFGALHGGSQITNQDTYNGNILSVQFTTGDNLACKIVDDFGSINCIDGSGRSSTTVTPNRPAIDGDCKLWYPYKHLRSNKNKI